MQKKAEDENTSVSILEDPRFSGIRPFTKKVWLSSPTMHGEELDFVKEAIETNWARRDYSNAIVTI